MDVRLVFDPRLEIDPEGFVAQWSKHPDHLTLGSFVVERSGTQTFAEPSTMLTFIGGIAVGLLPNALWDGIKWTYGQLCAAKGKVARQVELHYLRQADGTEITILRIRE